jgi:glycyl-tRNA synthetase beta chain
VAKDLLVEIGTEEMPASAIEIGIKQLAQKAEQIFSQNRLEFAEVKAFGSPRRLVLLVKSLLEKQKDHLLEVKGPPKVAAFTEDAKPTEAAKGFARSQGVKISDLVVKQEENGAYVYAIKREVGKPTSLVLTQLLPQLVSSLSFPKSMRWGTSEIRFIRPIRWLLTIYGSEVIKFRLDGLISGRATQGHRFLAQDSIIIKSVNEYLEKLRENKVIVDNREREQLIRDQLADLNKKIKGRVITHEHVFREVVNLVEFPTVIIGNFSPEFTSLPKEVLIIAMESHQRYFPVEGRDGQLLPQFVVVHNGDPAWNGLIQRGHERVLNARLADAKFFFEEDTKKPLSSYVEQLKKVVFQERLGSLFQKEERVSLIAEFLAGELKVPVKITEMAKRAAYLCKADLVTEMVTEFPALQGVMGREYARASGEPEEVAVAIYEHYLPRSTTDELPQTKVGKIVSIADKLDTTVASLAVGLMPTGSEDPYALRRQTAGIFTLILANEWPLSLQKLISFTLKLLKKQNVNFKLAETEKTVFNFFQSRLRAYLIGQGYQAELVESVLALKLDNITDIKRRIESLSSVSSQIKEEILIAFTRCKNLAERKLGAQVKEELFTGKQERELFDHLLEAKRELESVLEKADYPRALKILASLKKPIDKFFDEVLVMTEDLKVRENRLRLLNLALEIFTSVADFSKISLT